MRIDELLTRGMSRDEARQEAMRQFGDLEATRHCFRAQDQHREDVTQRTLWSQGFTQDLRISVRSLARDAGSAGSGAEERLGPRQSFFLDEHSPKDLS
jgi:hypothetical protein